MNHPGDAAVARALCQIMAARHPGTSWTPLPDGPGNTLPGMVTVTLTGPSNNDTIGEGNTVVRRAA